METDTILHFWQSLATVSLGIIVTLIGFWVGIGRKIMSQEEIRHMIINEAPYNKDKQYIMERLEANKENQLALSVTLQKVMDVMSDLKIQIATLSNTLKSLEDRYRDR